MRSVRPKSAPRPLITRGSAGTETRSGSAHHVCLHPLENHKAASVADRAGQESCPADRRERYVSSKSPPSVGSKPQASM